SRTPVHSDTVKVSVIGTDSGGADSLRGASAQILVVDCAGFVDAAVLTHIIQPITLTQPQTSVVVLNTGETRDGPNCFSACVAAGGFEYWAEETVPVRAIIPDGLEA